MKVIALGGAGGMGKAAEDKKVLSKSDMVGTGRDYVRGFDTKICAPGGDTGFDLPEDLESLFAG